MRKFIFFLSLSLTSLHSLAQQQKLSLPPFKSQHIYFVCRAQSEKISQTIIDYNIYNSPFSHVAIGLAKNDELTLYHIEDRQGNAFTKSTPEQFILPHSPILTIYKLPISANEEERISAFLTGFSHASFDYEFSLSNDLLYCSEFCWLVSEKLNDYHFQPTIKIISDPFLQSFLGRSELSYIPIDYFLKFKGITKFYYQSF